MSTPTIKELLTRSELPRLEAQMLLQLVLQVPRTWLVAHDDERPDASQLQRFQQLSRERLKGQPMAYLTGEREFGPHCFTVTPAVLIPRPETELLVEAALSYLHRHSAPGQAGPALRVLDLGTGSGVIAISLALACPGAQVVATDVSADALQVAQQNAKKLGAIVEFFQGSWYDAVANANPFDLIVSNPPYIAVSDSHLAEGDLRFEPRQALTDGGDGLEAYRQIIGRAPKHLTSQGQLWLEHGWDQAAAVRQLLRDAGFRQIETRQDLASMDRISGGHL